MLTSAAIASYRENGYLLVEQAVEPALLDELRRVTAALIDASRAVTVSDEIYDLDEGHSAARPRLTRIKLPHKRHPIYAEALRSPRIVGVLQHLLGPDVLLQTSKLNTKAPGGGAAVEWHQDWAFYPHTNDDLLALGLMLDDVDAANGPLMVIPGSHKGPVLSHHNRDGVFCGAIDPDDPLFEQHRAVTLTGRAGDMTVHHARTLHGSAPNRSDRPRMILFFECTAADAWPAGDLGRPAREGDLRPADNRAAGRAGAGPPATPPAARCRLDLQDPEERRRTQRLRGVAGQPVRRSGGQSAGPLSRAIGAGAQEPICALGILAQGGDRRG
jgi:ectoine hydroxylase-related dioxygenase (phytanoyl-CoA dioxygenase family)